MSRLQKFLILYSLLSTLGLLMASCLLKQKQFDVQLDASDVLEYGFGGGELGADWTQIVISGDGHVTYHYTFPFVGTWPQEEMNKEHQLTLQETEMLFQSLVDAGLFSLRRMPTLDADVPRTNIMASFGGREVEASMDGTPDEAIHGLMMALIAKIHPER